MPRKTKPTDNPRFSYFTAKDKNVTRAQVRTMVKPVIDAANKRMKRLEEAKAKENIYSPALRNNPQRFSTAGKDKTELLYEYERARRFMDNPTSTLRGARRYTETKNKQLAEAGKSYDISPEDMRWIYDIADELSDELTWTEVLGSGEVIERVKATYSRSKNKTKANIKKNVKAQIKRLAERSQVGNKNEDAGILFTRK